MIRAASLWLAVLTGFAILAAFTHSLVLLADAAAGALWATGYGMPTLATAVALMVLLACFFPPEFYRSKDDAAR